MVGLPGEQQGQLAGAKMAKQFADHHRLIALEKKILF
jgi:hypothetical protein